MTHLDALLTSWKEATGTLPWGVQKTFLEALKLAEAEKATLVFGADYASKMPCLVNANAHVLASLEGKGGHGLPTKFFSRVVVLYDAINREINRSLNRTENTVHHITANVLIKHFGPIKSVEQASQEVHEVDKQPVESGAYTEPTDSELLKDWLSVINQEAPVEPEPSTDTEDSVRSEASDR